MRFPGKFRAVFQGKLTNYRALMAYVLALLMAYNNLKINHKASRQREMDTHDLWINNSDDGDITAHGDGWALGTDPEGRRRRAGGRCQGQGRDLEGRLCLEVVPQIMPAAY
jgi:hypothetical protein